MSQPMRDEYRAEFNLRKIINEEVNKVLIEVLDTSLSTKYKQSKRIINNKPVTIYRFRTSNNNSYDLEFYENTYNDGDVVLHNKPKIKIKNAVDIGFTTTNRAIKDNPNNYTDLTDSNEQFELFSRLNYLISEYINQHPDVKIYVVGYTGNEKKDRIYNTLYKNIFSKDFDLYKGTSIDYNDYDANYFIKKEIR